MYTIIMVTIHITIIVIIHTIIIIIVTIHIVTGRFILILIHCTFALLGKIVSLIIAIDNSFITLDIKHHL